MNRTEKILERRDQLWSSHPIITESAILPTRAVKDAVARVMQVARKARASIAFWADPMTGKSFCIEAIEHAIVQTLPGAGVLRVEAVEDKGAAEGRMLEEILVSLGYAHRIDRGLAGKRGQVSNALLALSGSAKHLFIIIDEAQDLSNNEFGWLKAVINRQVRFGVKVTTVMFGQRELEGRRDDIEANARSDLLDRFMKSLRQFYGVRSCSDIKSITTAMDTHSEYPSGTGWGYTEFVFPRAFASGLRFDDYTPIMWDTLSTKVSSKVLKKGVPMSLIAAWLANICMACKDKDSAGFKITNDVIKKSLDLALAE